MRSADRVGPTKKVPLTRREYTLRTLVSTTGTA